MKQSSKERLATLLMDELLERLATRTSIKEMLGDMTALPLDEVIEHILADVERAVEAFHREQSGSREEKPGKQEKPAEQSVAVAAPPVEPVEAPVAMPAKESRVQPPEEKQSLPAEPEIQPIVEQHEPPGPGTAARMQSSGPPQVGEEPPRVESRKPEPPAPEPRVQLDPIKLEFPKINLRIDVPAPPVAGEGRTGQSKKRARSEPREDTARKADDHQSRPRPPETPEATPGHERHDSTRKSGRSAVKEEESSRPVPGEQEKELHRLEELARKIEEEYESRRSRQKNSTPDSGGPSQEPAVSPRAPELVEVADGSNGDEEAEAVVKVEPAGPGKHVARARYAFSDEEHVYVHAVSRIPPGEEPSPEPFMLEEKGIDGRGFAFALDYAGMRVYLSSINPNEVNISRSMVLLLNKQESLQMQSVHESTLNDLRAHGILLPMEFGTVARGKDYLLGLIDRNEEDLQEALDELEKTSWWTVTASMLDSTIAGIVGTDVQHVGRERPRDRASYMSIPPGKKFDIKVLERILQREKKIAEAIHAELSKIVDRSDIETMIGLGSGSSEDWKVILKASYEVPRQDLPRFSRAVTDLQYHHLQYDLMLALTGNKDCLTLRKK